MASHDLTPNRYYGCVCPNHPEYNGLRLNSGKCVQCNQENSARRQSIRYMDDPVFRAYRQALNKVSRDANPGPSTERAKRRKLAKIQRVPVWADLEKIKEIYKEAARTGMTVDHIIPLRGKRVSGLHVHNNLQLLPASVNFSKGNNFPIKE